MFSRDTLKSLISTIEFLVDTHADLDTILIQYGLENEVPDNRVSIQKRTVELFRFLANDPNVCAPNGENLPFVLIERVVLRHDRYRYISDEKVVLELESALMQDGFTIENDKLVRSLPEELDLADARDELHRLLDTMNFAQSSNHLRQALTAHARGEWESANANTRTFFESLLDEVSVRLRPTETEACSSRHERRELLAKDVSGSPAFFTPEEWQVGGPGGLIRGIWKSLQGEGSHPGSSSEDDSAFRLHLVLLVSRRFLRRLADFVSEDS